MAYATSAELEIHGIPAVALEGFTGDPDDYLEAVSGDINTFLRGRYSLPLAQPYPPEIMRATCVLAAYAILSVRGFDPDGRDRNIRLRHDDTMAWLKAIARGEVNLSIEADATPSVHDGRPLVRSRVRDSSDRFR